MATVTLEETLTPAIPPFPMRRFTVAQYHRLARNGLLHSGAPFELLEGWIVAKMTRNPPHDTALDKSLEAIATQLPEEWRVRVQSAITTPDSEPEPDLAIVLNPADRYAERHPEAGDMALLVEVADSSLSEDRNVKARIYARAGVVIYWIVNVVDRQVEVFTDPTGPVAMPTYRQRQVYTEDQEVPLVIQGQEVARLAVRDLLPGVPVA